MDEIHCLRDFYAADLAVLLVDDPSFCGQAFANPALASTAFCIVYWGCAVDNISFAHELGHLQGACHHPEDTGPCESGIQYGHGNCQFALKPQFRTVMAIVDRCGIGLRIPYWSNPSVLYSNIPTGDVSLRNNARVLNESANSVATFRDQLLDNLVLQDITISNGQTIVYKAKNSITAGLPYSFIIQPGGSATLEVVNPNSGPANAVILRPGFTATAGSTFRAAITQCGGGTPESKVTLSSAPIVLGTQEKAVNALSDEMFDIRTSEGLLTNYPNPFNPSTLITYKIPTTSLVILKVFNMLGQELQTLVEQVQSAGQHQVSFDASNLPSGIYFYRLQTEKNVAGSRMLFLK